MKKLIHTFSVLLLFGCQSENPNQEVIDQLSSIYQSTLSNINYPYHNGLKADLLLKQLEGIPPNIPLQKRYDASYELLKAGRNQECINLVLPIIEGKPLSHSTKKYYRLLANAYLRLGEESNCFHKSELNACTLPFTDETTHIDQEGSKKAMELYQQLLAQDPNDMESKWLLNIAARTINKLETLKEEQIIPLNDKVQDGLNFINVFKATELGHAGGSSFADFDNDGDLDLFTTSYHLDENVKYYENRNGKWVDKTKKSKLVGITGGLNFIHGDVNNDGFQDILILRGGWLSSYGQFPLSLLINQDGKQFIDATKDWGIRLRQPTQTACFSDIDLDGKLDLIVGGEATQGMNIPLRVFTNLGSRFEEVTASSGINFQGFIKGVIASDVNNDRYPDLFVSVLGGNNKLYLNDPKALGTFVDASKEYGIERPWASFVSWFFDYDNDGYQDLYVGGYNIDDKQRLLTETAKDFVGDTVNFSHPMLYKNVEGAFFKDVTDSLKLSYELFGMGGNFGDVNNDGYEDIYIGTGEFNMWAVMPNRLFVNQAGVAFADASFSSGLAMIQKGHGISFGDFDDDGDQDIFHTIGGAVEGDVFMNYLYENRSVTGNWINLKLVGERSNKAAIGAKTTFYFRENGLARKVVKEVSTGGSFGNNSLELEAGLGQATSIDSVRVLWPEKKLGSCLFTNLDINKKYMVFENNCELQ